MAKKSSKKGAASTVNTGWEIEDIQVIPRRTRYPWAEIQVGQSIQVPTEKAPSAISSARTWGLAHDAKWASENLGNGMTRIGRIE